jgi:hypothetical protein
MAEKTESQNKLKRGLSRELGTVFMAEEPLIRLDTDEIDDAMVCLVEWCQKARWDLRVWDKTNGLRVVLEAGKRPDEKKKKKQTSLLDEAEGETESLTNVAPTALAALINLLREPPKPDLHKPGDLLKAITVIKNGHTPFERAREELSSAVQELVNQRCGTHPSWPLLEATFTQHGVKPEDHTGKFVVMMMPHSAQLPPEVAPLFRRINHDLPTEEELREILDQTIEPGDNETTKFLGDAARRKACRAARGLTRLQATGVFAAGGVKNGHDPDFERLFPKFVWESKNKVLNDEGLVRIHPGQETFKDVGGLKGAKDFMARLLKTDEFDDDPDVRAKGVLFVGPPGVGKSLIAKATGTEFDLPVLMVDIGSWFGGIVGETEAKTRKGFQILKAHAPCIAVIDEVEKVMPSARSGNLDSGVGRRMAGTFMTELNDMQESVFWVFTANDVEGMHEAFFRAERVDGVFYVPLPSADQRAQVWRLYLTKFFPEEVNGKKFPGHVPLDIEALLARFGPSADVPSHARRLAAALMAQPEAAREAYLKKVAKLNDDLYQAARAEMVRDDQWTPAEIRACCRLSRRLREPLAKTARRIRPVAVGAAKAIHRLELWAAESALSAETGEIYTPGEGPDPEDKTARKGSKKVRRMVRRVSDATDI